MKACVVQELSGPSGIVYTDIDDVTGEGGNVLIDVRAAGVCFPDLLLSKGEYQLKLPPPFVPGMETAGVVRAAPLTSGFRAGERVSAFAEPASRPPLGFDTSPTSVKFRLTPLDSNLPPRVLVGLSRLHFQ
jgi:NADPH:quinone reductase-like Zn-dependent oxidoreductase